MYNIQFQSLFDQIITYSKYLFVTFLGGLFFMQLVLSLNWPLLNGGDAAFLHYIAYLINEHDFVPYRDIFEVNMPGTYLFHMAIGKLFGYSDFAFRLVDTTWLTLTLIVSWLLMRPFGRVVAFSACFLFGLVYFKGNVYHSLQRDFIVLLPIATALLLGTQRKPYHSINLIHLLQGILFGLAGLIKPHFIIGLPVIILYNYLHFNENISFKKGISYCIKGSIFIFTGLFIVFLGPFIWLWQIGALPSFFEIFSSYTPLYLEMTGEQLFVSTNTRFKYLVRTYLKFGGLTEFLIASLLGIYIVLTTALSKRIKKIALLLISFGGIYSFYVVLGGKFWPYHWIPFSFFVCLCASLLLYHPTSSTKLRFSSLLPILAFMLTVLNGNILLDVIQEFKNPKEIVTKSSERSGEIALYINTHLAPDDSIQLLDWIRGGASAMLRTKKVTATPYITDFQFYHHVSTPYIQKLRKHFIESLTQAKPKILIDVYPQIKLSGIDVSYEFPELKTFIQQNYTKDYTGFGFDIYRLQED